jgi:hypothetical protein
MRHSNRIKSQRRRRRRYIFRRYVCGGWRDVNGNRRCRYQQAEGAHPRLIHHSLFSRGNFGIRENPTGND